MLTEIKQTYDAKISELKQMDCSGTREEVTQQIKSLEELNQALRTETQVLKENQSWLKKDNAFKTEQLDKFLKDCGN